MPRGKAADKDVLFENTPATTEELDLDEFLTEIGPSTAVIHILRLKPDGSRPQLGKTTMEAIREDPYEYLRQTYGGGRFMLMFRGSDRRIHGAKTLEVEGAPLVQGAPAANNGATEEKLPFHDRLLLYNALRPQAPAVDMGAMLAGMAAMMTALRPADPKQTDPLEMFRSMMTMLESMKKKEEKDPLTQLREVAGVIKEFSGDGGKEADSMWGAITSIGKDVIEKAAPILGQVATARVPAQPIAPAPVVARTQKDLRLNPPMIPAGAVPGEVPGLPAGTVVAGATSSVSPANAEENLRKWLGAQIALFKIKARAGKDPGFWIDYVFENDEEPGCQAVLYAIRQGATLENLMAFDAEIAQDVQLTAWFREVYNGVRAGLLQGSMDSGGQGGNPNDDSANAPARVAGPNGAGNPGTGVVLPDTDLH
jgi:hypothetical protein